MIVLDTHTLIWLANDLPKLGRTARRHIEKATPRGELTISSISYWELAMLVDAQRIRLPVELTQLRTWAKAAGVNEIPVDGDIAITGGRLTGLHGDPADRLIVATALCRHAVLLTADQNLLAMSSGPKRLDAQS